MRRKIRKKDIEVSKYEEGCNKIQFEKQKISIHSIWYKRQWHSNKRNYIGNEILGVAFEEPHEQGNKKYINKKYEVAEKKQRVKNKTTLKGIKNIYK